jgi:DNA-binding protein HU-beta
MKQIIKEIALQFDVSQKLAKEMVDSVIIGITNELINGDSVRIHNFGTFSKVSKPARKGRNPKTGEIIDIAAKTVIKFNPAKALKTEVQ